MANTDGKFFPTSPQQGDVHVTSGMVSKPETNGKRYVWDGTKWVESGTASGPAPDSQQTSLVRPQKTGTGGSGASTGSGATMPQIPDVGAPYDVELPNANLDPVNDILSGTPDRINDVPLPSVDDAYGDIGPMDNLGDQTAGYYDDIGYQQNDEAINKLYDDMMSLMDWDTAKGEVLREGSAGNRAMMAANAASGRGLGGSFISGQAQADINTQGNLMAKKENFLNNLVAIQQNRAQALATEHQLGQKYGIELDIKQADAKAEEDKHARDAEWELEGIKAAAQLGVDTTRYNAIVQAIVSGDITRAQILANELGRQAGVEAARIMAKAGAQSNLMGISYQEDRADVRAAADKEPSYIDSSSKTGVNVQKDPATGAGKIVGTDKVIPAEVMTAIENIDGQIKVDGAVIDIRSDLTNWAANNKVTDPARIKAKAGELYFQALIAMGEGKGVAAESWAAMRMGEVFGPSWKTGFSGKVGNNSYLYTGAPGTATA